ncbi:MAG: long-chain fatty acid--CoA ligase [Desulfobacteraceae bacterium]|nr:MAG: long-chain fatty acid--CoA ligase [Desulfobacteraceae bacterium]
MAYAYQTEETQCGLFFTHAKRFENDVFMRAKLKNGAPCSEWIDITWGRAADEARGLGAGLIKTGIEKNDRIGLFAHNRPRWVICDQAIQGAGGIGVPIYPTSTDAQLAFILNDCGAKAIIAGDMDLMDQAFRVKAQVPSLEFIVCMSPVNNPPDTCVIDYDHLMQKGAASSSAIGEFEKRRKALKSSDTGAIIYTSGTTGNPKGVVLSHANFAAQTDVLMSTPLLQKIIERGIRLESLSFLPLCHIMGRTTDYHLQMAIGTTINFAQSIKTIQQDLLDVRPNILLSIPRLYEKIYEAVRLHGQKLTGAKKKAFDWAMAVGDQASDHLIAGKPMPPALGIKFAIANARVYDKIRKVIGFDRLVVAGSGGAALPKEITKFFRSMNITITEGYGLTETTSAITSNSPVFVDPLPDKWIYKKALEWLVDTMIVLQGSGQCPFKTFKGTMKMMVVSKLISPRFIIKPGCVGRPCKDTEIKIAEDGEVLVKGPQVFSLETGYFNQKEKTREEFTEDGFFKTGDIGELDEDGMLRITDRKKSLLVTSGGKNIAPQPIEMALIMDMYIDQACVIGDGRNYLTALIVPQFDLLKELARQKGISHNGNADLIRSPEILSFFQERVDHVNENLARYEQIKKFRLLPGAFSEETGELTPTQKMKRKVIYEKYDNEINALYQ